MRETRGTIQYLADWLVGLSYDDIPERVLEKARLQVLSVLAAVHSASHTAAGRKILAVVEEWDQGGPCSLIPSGKKVSLLNAVFANTALSVAQDFDDYLLFGHTGHSAVLVSLMVAEKNGLSIKDAITTQVAANEIEGRIGASVLLGPHNGQAWSFIHLIGAAAAYSRLCGLDAKSAAHAMAVSMYQPNFVLMPGFMGPDSKLLTPATTSMAGVQAAMLAEKGFTGALDILDNKQGFFQAFSFYPLKFMISGLGKAWVTDTLAYKIYPGCAYIDTTVDAVLKIMNDFREKTGKGLVPEDVREAVVEATLLTVEMDHLSKVGEAFDVLNPVSINFSIPANVAICLSKGGLDGMDMEKESLESMGAEIKRLADRVVLKHDLELTGRMLGKMDGVLDLRRIIKELNIIELARARGKIQKKYDRSMGFGVGDVIKFLRDADADKRSRIWQGLKQSIGNRSSPEARSRVKTKFDMGELHLEDFTMPFSARVTLVLKDGSRLTHQQDIPLGGPGNPIEETRALVKKKYSTVALRSLPPEKVTAVLDGLEKLEDMGFAADLISSVCVG